MSDEWDHDGWRVFGNLVKGGRYFFSVWIDEDNEWDVEPVSMEFVGVAQVSGGGDWYAVMEADELGHLVLYPADGYMEKYQLQ